MGQFVKTVCFALGLPKCYRTQIKGPINECLIQPWDKDQGTEKLKYEIK